MEFCNTIFHIVLCNIFKDCTLCAMFFLKQIATEYQNEVDKNWFFLVTFFFLFLRTLCTNPFLNSFEGFLGSEENQFLFVCCLQFLQWHIQDIKSFVFGWFKMFYYEKISKPYIVRKFHALRFLQLARVSHIKLCMLIFFFFLFL
jgi:hypothetical protein